MPNVFISYNHKDKPFVQRLYRDLSALGAQVWMDEVKLEIGDSLFDRIEEGLDETHFLVVVLSPDSVSSSWVREELKQALIRQLAAKDVKVLPVLVRDCVVPGFLREKVYADFRIDSEYENSLEKLASSLRLRLDRVVHQMVVPKIWYCIYCGKRAPPEYSNFCAGCQSHRLYIEPGDTVEQCASCKEWNSPLAKYCTWCGAKVNR